MHAISSYHGPARHKHTQDWLQYTVPLASTQCKYYIHTTTWSEILTFKCFTMFFNMSWSKMQKVGYFHQLCIRIFSRSNAFHFRSLKCNSNNKKQYNSRLTAIFQNNLDKLIPECHHSGFYWSKNYVGGGGNWSYKICKATVKSSSPTNQHTTFYRPNSLMKEEPVKCKIM